MVTFWPNSVAFYHVCMISSHQSPPQPYQKIITAQQQSVFFPYRRFFRHFARNNQRHGGRFTSFDVEVPTFSLAFWCKWDDHGGRSCFKHQLWTISQQPVGKVAFFQDAGICLVGDHFSPFGKMFLSFLAHASYLGGGFSHIFGVFIPKLGEMFQFDYTIFFRWLVNNTTNKWWQKSKDAKGTHWHDGSPVNLAQRGPEASTEPPPLLTSFEAERQWRKCYEVLRHDPKWPVSRFTEKGCLARWVCWCW